MSREKEAVQNATDASEFTDAVRQRTVIERVHPQVNEGRFSIKRTPGEAVHVTADIYADGHDALAAVLRYRRAEHQRPMGSPPLQPGHDEYGGAGSWSGPDADSWHDVPMTAEPNDVWSGEFSVDQVGCYEYTIEAWVDRFATWRNALVAKVAAGQDVASELLEGAALVREAVGRAGGRAALASSSLAHVVAEAAEPGGQLTLAAALDPDLAAFVERHPDRRQSSVFERSLQVRVDRERARFGSWYEMFPRSCGPDPTRSGTFREAEERLLPISEMGFDVLYLPPIHPIGRSFRKGRNNALMAAPGDPGSPWAIGSEHGGHKSIDPSLGTLEDFDHFVDAARRLGLEIALDLAYQCSPDHPYVKRHPEWFRHRPDGTIKYAENPPKKYQDIYPFDFECAEWRALWDELASIVLFWIEHGVRIFRVDNPHTKPFQFWEWMIGRVQRDHPDVIFLSEAFTRPKVMKHLAKLGFTQSYTYFTWRNTKDELTEYFTELTQTDVAEYLRPNLFVNTPDILHAFLQTGGRPAFQIRLVLAATLGACYGMYSGFELCEDRAVPGAEEYVDSEKYQFRHRDWDRPGNITELVALVNRIRRENRALQFDRGLRFHQTDNPMLLSYSKSSPDLSNSILVVVNLDPKHMRHGFVRVPLAELGARADEPYEVRDLIDDAVYTWRGEWNYVRLDPAVNVAHVLRLK
jgi:starch synthase (maltosyl-transferring)